MGVPRSIHDVHKLTGCLAALSRFLSKAAEKQLPFFKILKKALEFNWNPKHHLQLSQLKEYLGNLPTLSVPKGKEVLYLYLATSKEAISAVLVREEARRQLPVYFISRSLKGPEVRYQPLEKLALALVNAARRLRPYFQAHLVQVRTDFPLQHVLTKPEASGRIAKWAIELGEHNISYVPRKAIKGQALADFLVEASIPMEHIPVLAPTLNSTAAEPPNCWQMYVEGASGKSGSRAGVLLISSEKQEFTYSLRFQFPTTNNEVEYEALLAGLRIAKEMKVQFIKVNSDSQVIVSHMLGEYEAKGERMKKYLAKAQELQKAFAYFRLDCIPPAQNSRADILSKLAAVLGSTPIEEVQQRSLEEAEVSTITEDDQSTWMSPLLDYLENKQLLEDKLEARRVLAKSLRYVVVEGILYKKSYL